MFAFLISIAPAGHNGGPLDHLLLLHLLLAHNVDVNELALVATEAAATLERLEAVKAGHRLPIADKVLLERLEVSLPLSLHSLAQMLVLVVRHGLKLTYVRLVHHRSLVVQSDTDRAVLDGPYWFWGPQLQLV